MGNCWWAITSAVQDYISCMEACLEKLLSQIFQLFSASDTFLKPAADADATRNYIPSQSLMIGSANFQLNN